MADSNPLQEQLEKIRKESEERDAEKRASSFGVTYLPPQKISINLNALAVLNSTKAKEAHLVPIAINDKKLAVIVFDPLFSKTKEVIEELKKQGYVLTIYVVSISSLNFAWSFYRHISKGRKNISGEVEVDVSDEIGDVEKELSSIEGVTGWIVKNSEKLDMSDLVEGILLGALKNRASDIHFEPNENFVKLRYRIDGDLKDIFDKFTHNTYNFIISRIKLLSRLKINIKDETQDGRFTINLENKSVEVRVAIAPSEFGEVIVMRLLDPEAISLNLKDLGLRSDDLKIIGEQLKNPHGMILNTGPTGSGKTTTLYAFLKTKNNPDIKIITIEDPIEYHLEGIEQTQVNPEAGYTFANGLRSLMRQDPDVILVGEIRDKETAEIAVQAALTGHLVFSTVHANEASGGVPRLLDLGAKPESLAPALNLLIAQRLVKKLCPKCKKPAEISSQMKSDIEKFIQSLPDKVNKEDYKEINIFQPVGCTECNNSGFKGRIGIYELMEISDQIRELIMSGAGQLEIEKKALGEKFVSMDKDGVLKVVSGITTFEEVEEIVGKINVF